MCQLDAQLGYEADQQDVGSLLNETSKLGAKQNPNWLYLITGAKVGPKLG